MKKILFTLLLSIFLIPYVNADTLTFDLTSRYDIYIENKDIFEEQANQFVEYYNTNLKNNYGYYTIFYSTVSNGTTAYTGLCMRVSNSIKFESYILSNNNYGYVLALSNSSLFAIDNNQITRLESNISNYAVLFQFNPDLTSSSSFSFIYDANFPILYNKNLITQVEALKNLSIDTLEITNFYSNSSIIINHNENIPLLKDLLEYDSFVDYEANKKGYIEVNLDNYEYVILNLKDYSKKEAFETNLQVKGSIGITPVYNYGQVEKSEVTDRCNLSYSSFTDYRFFILKNDLTNNAFYIAKACEENSSFRFDSNIFDITYVTTENVDDPVVTFGGVEYHTIPFNKLSNSANQNEQNNFIPGESGSSLTGIIDNISDFTSDIWNAISSFMGLVTKFFNTLPEEFRYLSITSFTVLAVIAIIKFIRG